ncbi:hypothetical protein ACFLUY_00250 [Chloroflexota bacterium]
MAIATKTLFAIGVLISVFCIGAYASEAKFEPQIITNTKTNINTSILPAVEYRAVESHTAKYVEKPVTVVEYVERVKRVPVELRNFSNLKELKQWLVEVEINTNTFYFQSPNDTIDCDDYAIALQQRALADGYLISLEITETGEYNGLFKNSELPPHSLHAINLAIIGKDAYYVEPQTGEVVFAVHLD